MSNLKRIIFWSIILLICLFSGVYGLIYNNKIYSDNKEILSNIIYLFNNSSYANEYKSRNIDLYASINKKNIVVTYDGLDTYKYNFILKNNYLEFIYEANDSYATTFLMVMVDCINRYYGGEEGSIYNIFTSEAYKDYTFEDGIEITENDNKITAKINLNYSLIYRLY